jgi:hypothetical protein
MFKQRQGDDWQKVNHTLVNKVFPISLAAPNGWTDPITEADPTLSEAAPSSTSAEPRLT